MEDKILKAIEGLSMKIDSLSKKVDSQGIQLTNHGNQLKENTQILKALEHQAEVNKAEHDKILFNMAEMSGEIKGMRKDLSTVEIMTANNWGDIAKLKSVK